MLFNYFLILITLLLIAGLALDAGMLELRTMSLQTAADAAAQEGMSELARNDSAWATAAATQATQNGYTNGTNSVSVTISNPPTFGTFSGDVTAVQVTISQPVKNILMGLVNGGSSTVSSTSVAKILPTCMWIMGPGTTSTTALKVSSAGVRPTCGVYMNTPAGQHNLGVDYFSTLKASRIRVFGASSDNSSSGTVRPLPRFGAAQKNDPLAYVTAPVFSSCNHTNYSISSGIVTLNPGTYCGGLTISGATVTFNAGLYIVTGGLNWSNCTLTGSGVTIYLTQGGGFGYGTVNLNALAATMSAPTTNGVGIKGVFLFADRAWVAHNTQNIVVHNSTVNIDGFWYALNNGLSVTSSSISGTNYFGMVIDNFYSYLGNTNGSANYAPLGNVSPLHYDDGALVQ